MPDRPRRPKIRLDQLLVERDLVDSREQAQRVIRAGQVRLGTKVLDKPGFKIETDAELELRELLDRFVSRGGWKLEKAFEVFSGLTPCPAVCADIGASTGGFTDCLLQHGAQRVYALDVGHGQLDPKLRNDPRVVFMEGINARYLQAADLPEKVDLVVSDVSFISLELIFPAMMQIMRPDDGQVVALIKPQFEAGRGNVGKGGVVRDKTIHVEVCERLVQSASALGLCARGIVPSPIRGPAGNQEYLLWLGNRPSLAHPLLRDDIELAVRSS